MFDYIKKDGFKWKLIFKEKKNILEEDKFTYPENRASRLSLDAHMVDYVKRPYAKNSFFSLLLSLIGLFLMYIAYHMSIYYKGHPELSISATSFSAFLFASVGLGYAIRALFRKDVRRRVAFVATGLSGLQFLLWIMIFFVGIRS